MEKKTAGIWKNRDADHNIVYSANFSLIETDLELSISALLSWEVTFVYPGTSHHEKDKPGQSLHCGRCLADAMFNGRDDDLSNGYGGSTYYYLQWSYIMRAN